MKMTTRKPTVGDRRFEVEWCSEIPVDEYGDSDMDRAKYHTRKFEDVDLARAYAREVFPKDAFGVVSITPVEFVAYDDDDAEAYPHVGFWQHSGEPEHYDGE